jgi:hypothetical protein
MPRKTSKELLERRRIRRELREMEIKKVDRKPSHRKPIPAGVHSYNPNIGYQPETNELQINPRPHSKEDILFDNWRKYREKALALFGYDKKKVFLNEKGSRTEKVPERVFYFCDSLAYRLAQLEYNIPREYRTQKYMESVNKLLELPVDVATFVLAQEGSQVEDDIDYPEPYYNKQIYHNE